MKYAKNIIAPRGAEDLSPPYSFRLYIYAANSDKPIELPHSCSFRGAYRLAEMALDNGYTAFGREIEQIEVSMPISDLRKRVRAQLLLEMPMIETPFNVQRNGKRGEFIVYASGFYYTSDGAGNLTKKA